MDNAPLEKLLSLLANGISPIGNMFILIAVLLAPLAIAYSLRLFIDLFLFIKAQWGGLYESRRSFYNFALASIAFGAVLFFLPDFKPDEEDLSGFASTNAEVIGTAVAIIFSFSIFVLQRMANFVPAQRLDLIYKSLADVALFILLVALIFISLFLPILFSGYPKFVFWSLLITLLASFFLIYHLYVGLKKKIDPLPFIKKISDLVLDALEDSKEHHSRLYNNSKEVELFAKAKDYVDDLYETGVKLLERNDLRALYSFIDHMRNIGLKHMEQGCGNFIGNTNHPNHFTDKKIIIAIGSYLYLMGERLFKKNEKDGFVRLTESYVALIKKSLNIKYVDNTARNIIARFLLKNYKRLTDNLLSLPEEDVLNHTVANHLLELSKVCLEEADTSDVDILDQLSELLKVSEKNPPSAEYETQINSALQILNAKINGLNLK